jgi:isoquinoline 1-oxidoreductase subunit alpha
MLFFNLSGDARQAKLSCQVHFKLALALIATPSLRKPIKSSRRTKSLFLSRVAAMIKLSVNGSDVSVDADPDTPLLWVLRDFLGMTGTKFGCGIAQCGACTVHVDGDARRSCVTPVGEVADASITTVEAVGGTPEGKAVQEAWLALEVPQCGYCQSGQVMSASALLMSNPTPTDRDIDLGMSGNICRCGTYVRIREAVMRASLSLDGKGE